MKDNGIPDDQIILMNYDDIANSPSNPFRGEIYNKPTKPGTPGEDLYKGAVIDYKGSNINI